MGTRIVFSSRGTHCRAWVAAPAALVCRWGMLLAPAVRAQTYTGYLDGANCASIGGWAWDGIDTDTPAVDLLDGSTPIQTITANQLRSDLVGSAGSGYHAYGMVTPDSLKDNQPHTIHARYHTTGVELTYSPRTFSCAYDGYLNGVTPLTINGWGWKVNSTDRMPVNLYDGNQLAVQTTANQYRSDLSGMGDGYHAYRAAPTGTMNNGQDHYIYARIADQGTLIDLQYSPMLLHPNTTAVDEGYFDVASCDMLAGWVVDENHPLNRFTVAFYDGTSLLPFTATASLFRQDLLDAQLGDGAYAFSIVTPPWLKDGATHQITARMQASGFALTGSPKALSCQPPPMVSALPASGSGSAQTFTLNVFNSAGAANINLAYLLVNSSFSGVGGCYVEFNRAANTLRLQNDAGTGWLGPISPGSAASLSNSQCTTSGNGASSVAFGNYLSITIPTSFAFAFSGAKSTFGFDYDNAFNGSGWITTGSWTVPSSGPPAAVSALPASGSGLAQTFTLTVADGAGAADIGYAYLLVNSSFSGFNACWVEFNRVANTFRLQNDSYTGWLGPITLGSAASLSNSQCTIAGSGASSVATGNNLTIAIPASFAFAFVGAKTVFGYAYDNAYNGGGWVTTGTWTALPPPAVVSALPASGSSSAQTFSLTVADSAGAANIGYAYLLVNSSLSGFNACWVEFNHVANTFRLQNDGNTGWLGPITVGSAASLSNSQCTISGNGASGVANGNNLTVTIPTSFASAFAGAKTAFGYAYDNAFNGSDWVTTGTWTVLVPPADFTTSLASTSGTTLAGGSASYTVTVTPVNGFSGTVGLAASSMLTGAHASFNPSSITNGSGTSTMTITTAAGSAGNYSFAVTGTGGSLTHTATGSLAVQDYILTISPSLASVIPTSPGNVATFTVTATPVNGYSGTVGLTPQWLSGGPSSGNNWTPANSVNLDGVHPASTAWVVTNNGGIGTWAFTIYGGSSSCTTSPNHCAYSYFNVATQPDFTLGVSPSTLALTPPVNTSPGGYTISLTTLNGSCGTANFSVSGVPTGAVASFNPASVAVPGSGTVTTMLSVNAPAGTRAGNFSLSVIATCGSFSHPTTPLLTIGPADFSLTATPSTQTVAPAGVASYLIGVSGASSFSGSVNLSASGLPQGVSAGFSAGTVAPGGSSTLTLTTSANSPVGNFPVTIIGTSGSLSRTTVAFLNIASASPAAMLTPAPGVALRGTTATFVWNSGVSVSQYQLLVGATPGGSEYYSANTGGSQSATATIPTASQPQTVYAKLGSLIAGTWQYRSYTYSIGLAGAGGPGSLTDASGSPPYEVPNNGLPTISGPWYLIDTTGQPLDARSLTSDPCLAYKDGYGPYEDDPLKVRIKQVPSQYDPYNYSSWDVEITVSRSMAAGPFTFSCLHRWGETGSDYAPTIQPTYVIDSSPEVLLPVNQIEVDAATFYVEIYGRNFGNNQGTINICNPGLDTDPCNNIPGVSVIYGGTNAPWATWTDTQVNVMIQFPDGAFGPYDLVLTSAGVGANGFQPASQGRGAKSNRAPVQGRVIAGVSMKLEQVGATVISTDGRYSEDTTIRVTAVDATGAIIPSFVGTVSITEVPDADGATNYSQNQQPSGLPPNVAITSGGTATFVAKSLAGPKSPSTPPNPAQVKTLNYPVYRGVALEIPQWIVSGTGTEIDPMHAGPGTYDWFQARAKDIFASATAGTDVQIVLSAVSKYNLTDQAGDGYADIQRAPQSPIFINPYRNPVRTNSVTGALCGQPSHKRFTGTLLHEARHAYQSAQASIAGNDQDGDWLVGNPVAVAPPAIFQDTTTARNVCNEYAPGSAVFSVAYKGDTIFDAWLPSPASGVDRSAYVDYALEMDAEVFAASHSN
jgi:hypothetical protein